MLCCDERSIWPSVKRMNCEKMKESSAYIFTLFERSVRHVWMALQICSQKLKLHCKNANIMNISVVCCVFMSFFICIWCSMKSRDRRSSRERDRKRSRSRSRERYSKRHRSKSPTGVRLKPDTDKLMLVSQTLWCHCELKQEFVNEFSWLRMATYLLSLVCAKKRFCTEFKELMFLTSVHLKNAHTFAGSYAINILSDFIYSYLLTYIFCHK